MTEYKRTHHYPRTLAKIAVDLANDADSGSDLRDTKRVSRIIDPICQKMRVGVDYTDLGNLRVHEKKLTLYVKNTSQHQKLRQMLPRIERGLAAYGIYLQIDTILRPTRDKAVMRENLAKSMPRTISKKACEEIYSKAEEIEDSPLRRALISLSRTLHRDAK